ncbi:hypothetical protein D3C83_292990 [compost metagenome]
MTALRAWSVAPSLAVRVRLATSPCATDRKPVIACSSKVPRLVLLVTPQVPDWSPVPISSRRNEVE